MSEKLTITGVIKEINEPVHISDKFTLYEFVITTTGQYPKDIAFQATEKAYGHVKGHSEGKAIMVSFEPESKRSNGRWFTNLRAYNINFI